MILMKQVKCAERNDDWMWNIIEHSWWHIYYLLREFLIKLMFKFNKRIEIKINLIKSSKKCHADFDFYLESNRIIKVLVLQFPSGY